MSRPKRSGTFRFVGLSYVVTGGGRGIGRAIAERLIADGGHVVVVELDPAAVEWATGPGVSAVVGDVRDESVADEAADAAQAAGTLKGWVNNAAVFRDAAVDVPGARDVIDAVALNFDPAVVGSLTAIRRFLDAGTGGAVVNVSSHQAARPVRGSLTYATAKAAICTQRPSISSPCRFSRSTAATASAGLRRSSAWRSTARIASASVKK